MICLTKAQKATLRQLCDEPGLPRWHYIGLKSLPVEFYRVARPRTAALFTSEAYPTKVGREALAVPTP